MATTKAKQAEALTEAERLLLLEEPEIPHGMGWQPDLPDFRDYTPLEAEVGDMLDELKVTKTAESVAAGAEALGAAADLRPWFPPVEDQGSLGSCTANAGVGIVEYYERRAFGEHLDASRLFLYKVTRNLLGWTGDTGAYLRTTMGAMRLFGVPPERYWPYQIAQFDLEPPAFCYAFAANYQAIKYFRLDPPVTARDVLLNRVKTYVQAGIPSMFGFTVYTSIAQARTTGRIPLPSAGERVIGGHAVVACGYDDGLVIANAAPGGPQTVGALKIRNSWGTSWGDGGYGWIPYEYVLGGLAVDWWALLKLEWVKTGQFGL